MRRKIVYNIIVVVAVVALYLVSGPSFGYEARGKRDPFVPLIGLAKEKSKEKSKEKGKDVGPVRLAEVGSVNDILLEGVAIGAQGKNVAILNGQMVKENDEIGVLRIIKISRNAVELSIDGKVYTLSLRKEKGI